MLSIIVPVYNVEQYLRNSIDSLLNQKYFDIEIILIDDGSLDLSGKICDEYSKKDKRVRVIHQENGGLSSARNIGLKNCRGSFVTFVDPDDEVSIETYLSNIEYLDNHPDIDILQFPTFWNYSSSNAKYEIISSRLLCGTEEIFANWWRGDIINASVCNKIYRKHIFDNICFPVGHVFEDLYLLSDFAKVSKKLFISEVGCYYYYLRNNSISNCTYSLNKHIDHFTSQFKNYKTLYSYVNLRKDRAVAFMRVYRRLLVTKLSYPELDTSLYYTQLSEYLPNWEDIISSSIQPSEKLNLFILKVVGLNGFLAFFLYKKNVFAFLSRLKSFL